MDEARSEGQSLDKISHRKLLKTSDWRDGGGVVRTGVD